MSYSHLSDGPPTWQRISRSVFIVNNGASAVTTRAVITDLGLRSEDVFIVSRRQPWVVGDYRAFHLPNVTGRGMGTTFRSRRLVRDLRHWLDSVAEGGRFTVFGPRFRGLSAVAILHPACEQFVAIEEGMLSSEHHSPEGVSLARSMDLARKYSISVGRHARRFGQLPDDQIAGYARVSPGAFPGANPLKVIDVEFRPLLLASDSPPTARHEGGEHMPVLIVPDRLGPRATRDRLALAASVAATIQSLGTSRVVTLKTHPSDDPQLQVEFAQSLSDELDGVDVEVLPQAAIVEDYIAPNAVFVGETSSILHYAELFGATVVRIPKT